MYVLPEWRAKGVAGALLAQLEVQAVLLGYGRVRLDTGPLQPQARHLYERAGYLAVPSYTDNPFASFWGEKKLPRPPP
jgi:GNAT superfamily N-acetyltransferase